MQATFAGTQPGYVHIHRTWTKLDLPIRRFDALKTVAADSLSLESGEEILLQ